MHEGANIGRHVVYPIHARCPSPVNLIEKLFRVAHAEILPSKK